MTQLFRRLLRKRATFAFIDGFLLLLALLYLMISRSSASLTPPITYLKGSAHLLIQLAELPERSEAETHTMPEWTLYGDGTLLFQSGRHDDLWQTHLSPDAVQHVLDVIINRDQFFTCSMPQYGSSNDDDRLLLTVDANGQQKVVTVADNLSPSGTNNIQTTHILAIERFLLAYQPSPARWYALDPDPDDNNGT
jgi:hypothetical protein